MSEILENLNTDFDDWFEIIEGVKIMPPSADIDHNTVGLNLAFEFKRYTDDNNIIVVYDIDVYLPNGNIFRPDLCIVCDRSLVGKDLKIHGAPDLVVEVLSNSTAKNDLGIKKTLYAKNGVKEYWIVDRWSKSVLVYKLDGDQYTLDERYHDYTQSELDALTESERAAIKDKIQVGIFPELEIDVKYIFRALFN